MKTAYELTLNRLPRLTWVGPIMTMVLTSGDRDQEESLRCGYGRVIRVMHDHWLWKWEKGPQTKASFRSCKGEETGVSLEPLEMQPADALILAQCWNSIKL